jgi:hypothetical protein
MDVDADPRNPRRFSLPPRRCAADGTSAGRSSRAGTATSLSLDGAIFKLGKK